MGEKIEKTVAGGTAKVERDSCRIEHDDGTVEYVSKGPKRQEAVDNQSQDSFPASDPPSFTPERPADKPKHPEP